MHENLIDMIITGVISSGVIAAIISGKFGGKNAIHGESEWRKDLFQLSKRYRLSKEDIELFRTCVSALRGTINHDNIDKYDPYYLGQKSPLRIDDLCLIYYYYLINLFYKENGSYIYISKSIKYISDSKNDVLVFRQLCRLLVKADWNKRMNSNILSCQNDIYKDTDRKALIIIGRHLKTREGRLLNIRDRIKRQSYRIIRNDYKKNKKPLYESNCKNNPNKFVLNYNNRKKLCNINKSKQFIIIFTYTLISLYLFFKLCSNYLSWKSSNGNVDIIKQLSIYHYSLNSGFVHIIINIVQQFLILYNFFKPCIIFENLTNIISIIIFIIFFIIGFFEVQKLMFPYNK